MFYKVETMEDLRICLVQSSLIWEDRTQNTALLYDMVREVKDADIIVLPELFSTGFSMNVEPLAIEPDGEAVQWMRDLALEKQACVVGSLIIRENERFYNRLYWMFPDGTHETYDKRHLFTLAGEEKSFTAGTERLLVTYKGWTIIPLVCYDLRFPVWCRNDVGYDLAIFVANWPARRNYPWQQLLKARAIENVSYVAGVNRVGEDGSGVWHSGDSALIDPLGKEVSAIKPGEPQVEVVTASAEMLQKTRERFAFLNDRDQFTIEV